MAEGRGRGCRAGGGSQRPSQACTLCSHLVAMTVWFDVIQGRVEWRKARYFVKRSSSLHSTAGRRDQTKRVAVIKGFTFSHLCTFDPPLTLSSR